jgi:hypothetical protein
MIKAMKKLGIEGMHLKMIEAIYGRPIDNIILNGEKRKPFPSGTREGGVYCLYFYSK